MLIQEVQGTISVTSGTGFANIPIGQGELSEIVITPTTSTNVYDITITNNLGHVIFDTSGDSIKGGYSEAMKLPVREDCTLTIVGASIDEAIRYYLCFVERYA